MRGNAPTLSVANTELGQAYDEIQALGKDLRGYQSALSKEQHKSKRLAETGQAVLAEAAKVANRCKELEAEKAKLQRELNASTEIIGALQSLRDMYKRKATQAEDLARTRGAKLDETERWRRNLWNHRAKLLKEQDAWHAECYRLRERVRQLTSAAASSVYKQRLVDSDKSIIEYGPGKEYPTLDAVIASLNEPAPDYNTNPCTSCAGAGHTWRYGMKVSCTRCAGTGRDPEELR